MAEKESKKRKRQSNGVDTPSKKVAIDAGGNIKVSYTEENGVVLLSTPGVNAPRVPFKAYAKATSTKHANDAVKPKTHDLLLQSSQHPRLDYTAVPDTLDQHTSHYVAVFDPATKELHVTPAHHLSLRSTLRSEVQEVEQDRLTLAQQREELGREFGTKKAKKAILSKTENAITQDTKGKGRVTDVQSAILESVGGTTAGAANRDAQQDAETQLAAKPIPRPNLSAETVEDVYSFDTLIPPSDARMIQIKEWQDKVRADEVIQFKHRFPADRVEAIAKSDDAIKLKALRYLTLLLEFHDVLGSNRGGKKVPKKDILSKRLPGWPQNLVDTVRRRFTNDSGSELGKWQLDNMYTHMCALSLYIDGWTTDTSNLKDDLKMETKQISQYFNELGCKVSAPTEAEKTARKIGKAQAAVTRMARLKLPLEFPKPRAARRR
ncbi:hypothetical protein M409DRAFT_49324 [Zasmidium cellare ATCC 36951]|uniref:RNA polymerase I associated factor, A49-like protein n=1 Tax=Zasmidium cellare ATCC 36951 TaxID=1080233 RepID=A0A6A6D561_ZASCE|nr:uncharacterized protein M409DRAFT_49324 [Zasmidium cellare ATCC 36951]KAF2172796.1 hypothetical protein M409DRAFT_49324 [Zasmidium cellare ATCC 36951]